MLYAVLCYHDEKVVSSWSQEQDDAVMDRLGAVHRRLTEAGKLGPALRLGPTTTAATLRKAPEPFVVDGPFAETKEQLLGFYLLEVDTLEEALDCCRELAAANPGGAYEVRPISLYLPDRRGAPEA